MVRLLHVLIDMSCLAAITVGAWLIHPAAGLLVGGIAGLLLHYAVSTGNYE